MTIQGFTLDVTERGQEVVVHVVYVDRVEEVVKWRNGEHMQMYCVENVVLYSVVELYYFVSLVFIINYKFCIFSIYNKIN